MTTEMAPPPPRNHIATAQSPPLPDSNESSTSASSMAPPPPPKNPNLPQLDSTPAQPERHVASEPEPPQIGSGKTEIEQNKGGMSVPYTIPEWSGAPCHCYSLEVLKDGSILDQLDVYEKGAYMFGRVDLCDFVLEHPTISRFHAVLQYKRNGIAYIHDLGSTHGTFVNKNQVKKKVFVELHVGDVIRFGQSSRLYILQGPSELMPPESDLKRIKKAKQRVEMEDMEASLLRAKIEAARADGISWGMGEDAIEETEDDVEEVTWQSYKGQLTEKQEKTREKVLKRLEKIGHMKKEIEAIRVKDIPQGGLTQGQQTQIARNEQRIEQIMEELESLEETLNESIKESLGARGGKTYGKKKGVAEDDEEYMSDDDDFYDRTKKRTSYLKGGENQSVETAETLLEKKGAIIKEMEEKKKLFIEQREKMASGNEDLADTVDELDAYMSGLSSQLVIDRAKKHEKEMSILQTELDRILYLLKIADPMGEACKKRDSKIQEISSNESIDLSTSNIKQISSKLTKPKPEKSKSNYVEKDVLKVETKIEPKNVEGEELVDKTEEKTAIYTVAKPQWLGAVNVMEIKEKKQENPQAIDDEPDQFVDYKDRKTILNIQDTPKDNMASEIENAAPGLIVRKRKQIENTNNVESAASEVSIFSAEDAIALLLKHEKGYYASEDGEENNVDNLSSVKKSHKDSKRPKKVLGPEKPPFLKSESDYETWVPPKGQSGDGRTSLNDRFGY